MNPTFWSELLLLGISYDTTNPKPNEAVVFQILTDSSIITWLSTGQWIVTWARLRNLGQVVRYVPVTCYNFIHQLRL